MSRNDHSSSRTAPNPTEKMEVPELSKFSDADLFSKTSKIKNSDGRVNTRLGLLALLLSMRRTANHISRERHGNHQVGHVDTYNGDDKVDALGLECIHEGRGIACHVHASTAAAAGRVAAHPFFFGFCWN